MKTIIAIVLFALTSQAANTDVVLGIAGQQTFAQGVGNARVATWGSSFVSATGGAVTNYTVGGINYRSHIFTNSGTFSVTSGGIVEALIVAGGGGGSSGGGGAGGMITGAVSVSSGSLTVTVGLGGAGGPQENPVNTATNGQNSSALGLIAYGGGAGGVYSGTPTYGIGGGSGGGGGISIGSAMIGGSATNGQGNVGGTTAAGVVSPFYSSGGGGAGGAGVNGGAETIADGGSGITNAFSGIATVYAKGGRGSSYFAGAAAENGPDTLGYGGSGMGTGAVPVGGNGGSGIVIIRYRTN